MSAARNRARAAALVYSMEPMILENARSALRALRVNTLRTALTMLGIIIGVGAVIAMMAVGAGARARVTEQIQSLGSNLIIVSPGSTTAGGVRAGQGSQLTITEDDAIAIQREIPTVQVAAPHSRGSVQVVYGNLNWGTAVTGVTPEVFEARDWSIADGRPITAEDHRAATKVVLVGQTVALNLFQGENPVGLTIRIRKVPFTVVGVLDPKGQNTWGQDQDDIVMVPLSTAKQKLLGRSTTRSRAVQSISVKIWEGEDLYEAETQLRELLRQRHRLQPYQDDDFTLRVLADVLQTQEEASRVMAYLLAAIASVSLLVGGIGIMNIMLVSVTERTREIGLRMSVGARRRDILAQFLVEAVTVALIGGAIGIAVGLGGSYVISHFAEWRTLVAVESIVVAFCFAAAIGILFGFYPARKAARLDPIEALRWE
jgi:putative ABC transport system permease protein